MTKWKNKKVGVLMGGISKEREVSLRTGEAVFEALKRCGYNALALDVGPNIVEQLQKNPIDVAFIALHGVYGEDGSVQGLLEWLKIPYTGSGVLASALAFDKAVLNNLVRQLDVLVPKEIVFDSRHHNLDDFLSMIHSPWSIVPVVVKPSREGSTINLSIVREAASLKGAVQLALQSDCKVLIEEYIKGKEVTVAVLNGTALPSIEIVPKDGFYDYQHKYTKGMTEYILPARISEKCRKQIAECSVKIFNAIDCAGVARADFIVTPDEKSYFLEINTIPGMTETSLVPKAAAHAGISFEDLCEMILEKA